MRRLPLLVLLALVAAPVSAQGVRIVTIVNADSVAGEVVDGERVRRLIGNVHLRQDTTDLRAARATQYLDRDLIVFEGNVSIADPSDTLRAARVSYDSARRIGRAEGNVRLADAEAVVTAAALVYFRTERRAVTESPVRLVEREGGAVLTSRRGTYLTDRKEALFEGDVRLEDEATVLTAAAGRYGVEDRRAEFTGDVRLVHRGSSRLRADTLTHDRDTRVSVARGRVLLERFGGPEEPPEGAAPDTTRRTLLYGGFIRHDERARTSRVERGARPFDPLVVRLVTDSLGVTDSLFVQARTFDAFEPEALDPPEASDPPEEPERAPAADAPPEAEHPQEPEAAAEAGAPGAAGEREGASRNPAGTDGAAGGHVPAVRPAPLRAPPRPLPEGATLQRLVAVGDVRVAGARLGARADSTVLDRLEFEDAVRPVEDEVRLFGDPVLWLNRRGSAVYTQISGERIVARGRGEALDTVLVLGGAFGVYPDSALARENLLRGRQMLARFREDTLRALHVWPEAEALFFRADSLGRLVGAVQLGSDSLAFAFRGEELERVAAARNVDGTYFEAALVPEDLRLPGPPYAPERRPTRGALLAARPPLYGFFDPLPPDDLPADDPVRDLPADPVALPTVEAAAVSRPP